jgi:methionyl-tRNA formyltransferase
LGLDVWLPETVNSDDILQRIEDRGAELLVVCDYGEILKRPILAVAPRGAINLHGSLLPKYRGAAPVQWAIAQGETQTGNTVIQLTAGLDAGPILGQAPLAIRPGETAGELEERLAEAGAPLVLEVLDRLEAGTLVPVPQDESQATRAPRLRKADGAIDWTQPAAQIERHVRAMQPWPKAFTDWERPGDPPLRLILTRVRALGAAAPPIAMAGDAGDIVIVDEEAARDADIATARPRPGMVVGASDRLVVQAGDGTLQIEQLQPAGRRVMAAEEFLRGYPLQPGQQFVHPKD